MSQIQGTYSSMAQTPILMRGSSIVETWDRLMKAWRLAKFLDTGSDRFYTTLKLKYIDGGIEEPTPTQEFIPVYVPRSQRENDKKSKSKGYPKFVEDLKKPVLHDAEIPLHWIRPLQPLPVQGVFYCYDEVDVNTGSVWRRGRIMSMGKDRKCLKIFVYHTRSFILKKIDSVRHIHVHMNSRVEVLVRSSWFEAGIVSTTGEKARVTVQGHPGILETDIFDTKFRFKKDWVKGNVWLLHGEELPVIYSGWKEIPIVYSDDDNDAETTTTQSTQVPTTSSVPPTTTVALTTTESPAANLVPQEASNLVVGYNFEEAIQQILDREGETWDIDTVDYLYYGILELPEVPPATQPPMGELAANLPAQAPQLADPIPPSGPNANPLNLFQQGLPNVGSNTAGSGNLDFLRNNVQFQALRNMVKPMLQELGKQNPQLMRLIQEHQADFLNLINEPVEGEENVLGQLAAGMSQQVAVTPEERDAIERGIPEQPEVPPATQPPIGGLAANLPAQAPQPADPIPPSGPNANPFNLFSQGLPSAGSNTAGSGNLDFLRNNVQFQALSSTVQHMLQELGKQNPQLIQEHQTDFLNLINEPVEGEENVLGQLAAGMSQQVAVTPEERDAVERLEAMGFDRAIVLEVFFACNKNEELAANYLLDHSASLSNLDE